MKCFLRRVEFPFAQTDNGDFLFWETAGESNKWRIIVNEGRGPEWEIFDISMTEFIAGILTRQVEMYNLFGRFSATIAQV